MALSHFLFLCDLLHFIPIYFIACLSPLLRYKDRGFFYPLLKFLLLDEFLVNSSHSVGQTDEWIDGWING